MFNAALYNLTQSLAGALFTAVGPIRAQEELAPLPDLFNLRAGYAESPGWFLVQAVEFDPEPLNVKNLRVRDTYASESLVAGLLEIMASEKWLHRRGEDFFLSELGQELARERRGRLTRWLAALQPHLSGEIDRLEEGLAKIILASIEMGTPPGNWCLFHSRNRAPADNAPAAVKVFQYTSDFNAFRDDAHMAAWGPLGIDGRSWEAFSLLCDGSADSAAALFDQLAYRGYSQEDYADALADLEQRGWISRKEQSEDNLEAHYRVSAEGRQLREKVENLTDEYFFAPWQQIGKEKSKEVIQLMEQLQETLQEMGSSSK